MNLAPSWRRLRRFTRTLGRAWLPLTLVAFPELGRAAEAPFGIRTVDAETGRGIPLVELETVNHLRFVTDSAGWVAFAEPGLMERPVFFQVSSHGYTFPKDGLGYAGVKLTPTPGGRVTLKLHRRNIAERLYRVTGEGIYRDSVLLGTPTPLRQPLGSGRVAGQDSAFAVPYRGQLFWFWGDTSRLSYPLGHFWMAGAVSALPGKGGLDPAVGIDLRYFTDATGFSRPMCRLGVKKGLIWADAFCVLPDAAGHQRLVCHYAHMKSLGHMLDHGLAIYNDEQEKFERLAEMEMKHRWCWPGQAHPLRLRERGIEYLYLGEVFPVVRVRAQLESFRRPAAYEAWSCLADGASADEPRVLRDAKGRLQWRWTRHAPPVDAGLESRLIQRGLIQPGEARFTPVDVVTKKRVRLHRGSVAWNPWRQRWIVIANQQDGTSNLGEVWYAEAWEPTGPWRRATKIVTHNRYSFYNPVHHPFFDQEDGRIIYFEGTYSHTFSGNAHPTPRYDYNQIMYQLDLGDPRLQAVRATR